MRSGTLPNGEHQAFYFPEDHPLCRLVQGMEVIIRERGLWPGEGIFLPSARAFVAPAASTAAADAFSLCSPTCVQNPASRAGRVLQPSVRLLSKNITASQFH